jgi:beta-glucosidase
VRFPASFVWGVATSAYQIEGETELDGRGPSIWDTFAKEPGRIRGGDDGRRAADHRRRMPEDVQLIADLGVDAYRFSIAWPRVQPSGRGPVNQRGLDFYRELVDRLLAAGVEPVVTLYHWDLPQALEEDGGWPSRETALRFADYAHAVGTALGDRAHRWTTINEPWCVSMLGYAAGVHAPGRCEPASAIEAGHHVLLAHGLAIDALRDVVVDAELAITLNPYPVVTKGDRAEDHDAVRRVDGIANRLWYDAVLRGQYPDDVLEDFSAVSDLSHVHDGDLAQIARPIDALGVNYYRRYHVRHAPGASQAPPAATWPGSHDIGLVSPDAPKTASGWAIEPDGLRDALVSLTTDYDPPPLYIHECGGAFADVRGSTGDIDDRDRMAYLGAHLRYAHEAIDGGVDLRGLFVWSLFDNFEWAEGYAHRFGIVFVDFETMERVSKASAHWYAEIARSGELDAG